MLLYLVYTKQRCPTFYDIICYIIASTSVEADDKSGDRMNWMELYSPTHQTIRFIIPVLV